jgi:exonuclease VII small subunit
MECEEMENRLEKGEDPLELSIEKWRDIVDGKGKCYGPSNCALCHVYGIIESDEACSECPVSKVGHPVCVKTPYEDYEDAFTHKNEKNMQKYARQELAFLISLRSNELESKRL